MCSYTSSFLAGISYSVWLILSTTTFSFEDFSLVVFVDFLFCFCQFHANTIFFYAKCVLFFSRIFLFTFNLRDSETEHSYCKSSVKPRGLFVFVVLEEPIREGWLISNSR